MDPVTGFAPPRDVVAAESRLIGRIIVRVLAGLVIALLLWAGRFRYDHIVVDGETYLVRVQRMSGHADIMIPGEGWVPSEEAWDDSTDDTPQTPS
jgi:hypothetical protein